MDLATLESRLAPATIRGHFVLTPAEQVRFVPDTPAPGLRADLLRPVYRSNFLRLEGFVLGAVGADVIVTGRVVGHALYITGIQRN